MLLHIKYHPIVLRFVALPTTSATRNKSNSVVYLMQKELKKAHFSYPILATVIRRMYRKIG